jgi:hypothetical protein
MKSNLNLVYVFFLGSLFWVGTTSEIDSSGTIRIKKSDPSPCSKCHNGQQGGNDLKVEGFPSVIVPGETYTLTVRITRGNSSYYPSFELVIISDANPGVSCGVFPCKKSCGGGQQNWKIDAGVNNGEGIYDIATTSSYSNFSGQGNVITWEIDWRAEGVSPNENIKLYADATIGDGSGQPTITNKDNNDWSKSVQSTTIVSGTVCSNNVVSTAIAAAPTCAKPLSGTATLTGNSLSKFLWGSEGQRQGTISGLAPGSYSVTAYNGVGCATKTATVSAIPDNTPPVMSPCPPNVTVNASQAACTGTSTFPTPTAADDCNTPLTFTQNVGTQIIKGIWNGAPMSHFRAIPVNSSDATYITDVKIGIYKSNGSATGEVRLYKISPGTNLNAHTQLNGQQLVSKSFVPPQMNNAVFNVALDNPVLLEAGKDLVVELYCPNSTNLRGGYTDNASAGISYLSSGSGNIFNANTQNYPFFDNDHFFCKVNAYRTTMIVPTLISGLPSGTTFPRGNTSQVFLATDASGNTSTCGFTITVQSTLSASAVALGSTCGLPNGSISLSTTGGSLPYFYDWADLAGTNDPQNRGNLSAGTYSVTVFDGVGCTSSYSVTVTQVSIPPAAAVNASPPSVCAGQSTTLTASGGGTYAWSNGQSASSVTVSPAATTTYTVTVTSAEGCTATATQTIGFSPNPSFGPFSWNNPSCYQGNDGNIQITPIGGSFQYIWSNGSTNEDAMGLAAGTYTVLATDGSGCTSVSLPISLTEPPQIVVQWGFSAPTGSSNGSIQAAMSGGTPPYTLCLFISNTNDSICQDMISMGINTQFSQLSEGGYSMRVEDAEGCVYWVEGIDLSSSVVDLSDRDRIVLYPNPSTGLVGIRTNAPLNMEAEVWVYDVNGRLVGRFVPTGQSFDLGHLPAGLYRIRIWDGKGFVMPQSLIVLE